MSDDVGGTRAPSTWCSTQLDELVAVTTDLPDGGPVTHYSIVTEMPSRFERADLPSDLQRRCSVSPGRPIPLEQ